MLFAAFSGGQPVEELVDGSVPGIAERVGAAGLAGKRQGGARRATQIVIQTSHTLGSCGAVA